jgi:Fe2+ or Zn2+ uptake regulation protein
MYGYTDGNHDVFICFKCGRFDGISNNDPEFLEDIKENPVIILEMISDKILIPVK